MILIDSSLLLLCYYLHIQYMLINESMRYTTTYQWWVQYCRRFPLLAFQQSSCIFQHQFSEQMRFSVEVSLWLDPRCCQEMLCLWTVLTDQHQKNFYFCKQGQCRSCWTSIQTVLSSYHVEAQSGSAKWRPFLLLLQPDSVSKLADDHFL